MKKFLFFYILFYLACIYTCNNIEEILSHRSSSSFSSVTPMGKHFENRHQTTNNDLAWLGSPSNQPSFTLDEFKSWIPKEVNLYPFGIPQPADANQRAIGDCSLIAVLASFAYLYPDFIKNIISPLDDNSYLVYMYDPQGNPISVAVDNKFLCNNKGNIAQTTGKNNEANWATIMEKALMKWETIYQCNNIGGIGTEHASPPFTGNGDSFAIAPGAISNNEDMKTLVDYALSNGMISIGGFLQGGIICGTLETIAGHAFTVMYTAYPDKYLWSMRNPWGLTEVDGVLEIPNNRDIVKLIDFRLVNPGHARDYLRSDIGGYIVPKFAPNKEDLIVSSYLLKLVGLSQYPTHLERKDEN